MKKYVFESELTPEEIKFRLAGSVRCVSKGWRGIGNTMFYEWIDDAHFMLIRTGSLGIGKGQVPFIGELHIEGNKTIISGCFQPDKEQTRAICLVALIAMIALIIMAVFNDTILFIALPIYLIWLSLEYQLSWNTLPMFWRKANNDVIQYIEKRLLK